MRIKLPDSAYGFVDISGEETTSKEKHLFNIPTNIFVSVSTEIDAKKFTRELCLLNYDFYFKVVHVGWLNCQMENKRCTIKFEVTKKPLEQLKLFQ